jgi:hypothetical protein
VTDAAEPTIAGLKMGSKHLAHARPQRQVGMADDRRAQSRRAVAPTRTHRGDAIGKFCLAHRAQRRGTLPPVHRLCLHEDRRHDAVSGDDILQQIFSQITPPLAVPEMVMGIDDRQFGVQHILLPAGQPCQPDRQIMRGHW